MIKIAETEKNKIRRLLDTNPGKSLRIVVEGDGCAGPYFGVTLDEADNDEMVTKVNGIDVLVSNQVQRYADITTIEIFMNPPAED